MCDLALQDNFQDGFYGSLAIITFELLEVNELGPSDNEVPVWWERQVQPRRQVLRGKGRWVVMVREVLSPLCWGNAGVGRAGD